MSLMIAPDLWQQLCAILKAHATCQVVLHQHNGLVVKIEHWRNSEERVACYPNSPYPETPCLLTSECPTA
jgi:hypothetical protein